MNRLAFAVIFLLYLFVGWLEAGQSWPVSGGREGAEAKAGTVSALPYAVEMVSALVDVLGQKATRVARVADTTQDSLWLRPVAAVEPGENVSHSQALTEVMVSRETGPAGKVNHLPPPATATREPSDRSGNDATNTIQGTATYYHDSLVGGVMANGEIYNPWDPTIAASMDYSLGTELTITYSRTITVTVSDRGLLGRGHVDLSRAAFVELVGSVEPGVIDVEIGER